MLIPTRRLLLLAILGAAVIPLAGTRPAALLVAVLWLFGLLGLAVVDTRFVPPAAQLVWTRQHDGKLSLGAWNLVTLQLDNNSTRPAVFQVRDATPAWTTVQSNIADGRCPAGGTWTHTYRLYPLRRGSFHLGPAAARYLGPLGLAWRQHTVQLNDEVKVYPNLLAMRSYEALVRRGQLEELGLRQSRRWGTGTEFERLRDYTPDDEYRRINWPATARRHQPITVDYETERSQSVILVLDCGRLMSMRLPLEVEQRPAAEPDASAELSLPPAGAALTKLDYAANASLLLAFVALQRGDRAGLVAFSDRLLRSIAPGRGRRQLLTVIEALYDLEAEPTEPDSGVALAQLAARNPRRSLLVFFTDLTEPEAASALVAQLAQLARRHLVLVVTLRDPAVARLAEARPSDSSSVYQRAVAERVLAERQSTLLRLRQLGVLTLDVAADALSPSLINRYLEIKARSAL